MKSTIQNKDERTANLDDFNRKKTVFFQYTLNPEEKNDERIEQRKKERKKNVFCNVDFL